ncbi:hypothetical protein ACFLYB_05750 [Chloroflexota bacterium]
MKKTADYMAEILENDPTRAEKAIKEPAEMVKVIKEAKEKALIPDTMVYKIVVGSLGLIGVLAVIGAIILVGMGKETPAALVALGSAAVGALAGLLAPSAKGGEG